ncbi:hypothetical protein Taro_015984 [Colocasia esculenta]|uniref:Uncharacterized protein n=1 Tax=Colocasia esculenta TaxID=4460 RepID=A0A843UCS3_COLES|nr:hypothetical protein [Colocasia esculenta]
MEHHHPEQPTESKGGELSQRVSSTRKGKPLNKTGISTEAQPARHPWHSPDYHLAEPTGHEKRSQPPNPGDTRSPTSAAEKPKK